MSDADVVILNVNPDGIDVLHPDPGEQCNTDDAEGRQRVDARTAAALLARGEARLCEHCGSSEAT